MWDFKFIQQMHTVSSFPSCFCQCLGAVRGTWIRWIWIWYLVYKIQVQTAGKSRHWEYWFVSGEAHLFWCFGLLWGFFVVCVCFSLSVTYRLKMRFLSMKLPWANYIFFQLNWASILKMIQSHRPFLEQNKTNQKKIFAVRLYHLKSLFAEICLDHQYPVVVQDLSS